MVDVNFTLIVQLLLFLVFLWAMNRWVLVPLLAMMDQREGQITQDKENAALDQTKAEELEAQYASAIASVHRAAQQRLSETLREAQRERNEQRDDLKRKQDAEVEEVRVQARSVVDAERGALLELSRAVASDMMSRLGLGEKTS